jgi:hypothetical protein
VVNLPFSNGAKISGVGVTIAALLNGVAEDRGMGSILSSGFNYADPTKVKLTLSYVSKEMNAAELKDLREQTKDSAELMQICQDVQDRCMKKMHNAEVELKIYVPKEGVKRKAKPNFLGFAKRIVDLNKKEKEKEEGGLGAG